VTIPKEYNHNTTPPTLMNPWDHQVAAEVKARFGITRSDRFLDVAYMRAAAEVVQDHGSELSFGALKYQIGDPAYPRTQDDSHHVVISTAGGEVVVIGAGASGPFCKAIKGLIDAGTLQVLPPDWAMRFYPGNDAPKLPAGLTVRVVKGTPQPYLSPDSPCAGKA
jgi:hypothetical protein